MPPDPSAASSSGAAAGASSSSKGGASYRERVFWTPEEDALLLKLVAIHGSKRGKDSKWPIVAAALEGRNIKDCRKRYFHSLAPDLKKGRWSKEEDALLLKGLDELGPIWYKIAQMIPGRKDDQCAKRWKEVLDPSLSKGKAWSKDEDDLLLGLFEKNGPKWQHIAKSIPGRTGLCCRNRWRKFKGDEKVHGALLDLEERQRKTGGNAGGTRSHPQGGRGRRSVSFQTEGGDGGFEDGDDDDVDMDIDGESGYGGGGNHADTPSSTTTLGGPSSHFGEIPTPYGSTSAHSFLPGLGGGGGGGPNGFEFFRPQLHHSLSNAGHHRALSPPNGRGLVGGGANDSLLKSPQISLGQSLGGPSGSGGGHGLAPSYADHFSAQAGGSQLPSLGVGGNHGISGQINGGGALFGGPTSMNGQDHAGMLFSQDLGARLSAVESARNATGSGAGSSKHGLFNLVHQDPSSSSSAPAAVAGPSNPISTGGGAGALGGGSLHRTDNPHDPIARLLAAETLGGPGGSGQGADGATPSSLASASSIGSSPAFPTGSSPAGISPSSLSNESFATPASDHHHTGPTAFHPANGLNGLGGGNAAGGSNVGQSVGGGGGGLTASGGVNGNGNGGPNNHHLAQGSLSGSHKPPSHHVNFAVDHPHEELDQNDNPTWVTSFLASLHHPSASLPPTALNSPVFTGAWDSGLFSAPPSPQKHLFMHLPPMLDAEDLPPLPPPAVGAPEPHQQQSQQQQQNKGSLQQQQQQLLQQQQAFLRSPGSQAGLNSLQQSLQQQRSPGLHGMFPQQNQQQQQNAAASSSSSSSFARPMPQLASPRRERSPLHPVPTAAGGNGSASVSASASASATPGASGSQAPAGAAAGSMAPPPVPTTTSGVAGHHLSSSTIHQFANANGRVPSGLLGQHSGGGVGHSQQQLQPQQHQPQHLQQQQQSQQQQQQLAMPLPYLTWDPRPAEEQTNAVPMVLVPMSILAGLIERASMVDANGNPTGKHPSGGAGGGGSSGNNSSHPHQQHHQLGQAAGGVGSGQGQNHLR